jgi:beta-mannosidase
MAIPLAVSLIPGSRQFYEVILPEVVERLSTIFYHRSSPYGGKTSSDPTIGDLHQWNVWHGTQEPWANWDKLAGRFVSSITRVYYPMVSLIHVQGVWVARLPR